MWTTPGLFFGSVGFLKKSKAVRNKGSHIAIKTVENSPPHPNNIQRTNPSYVSTQYLEKFLEGRQFLNYRSTSGIQRSPINPDAKQPQNLLRNATPNPPTYGYSLVTSTTDTRGY